MPREKLLSERFRSERTGTDLATQTRHGLIHIGGDSIIHLACCADCPAVLGTTPTDAREPPTGSPARGSPRQQGWRSYAAEEFRRTPRLRKIRLTVLWLMAYRSASSRVVTPTRNSDANRHTPASPSRSMTRCCTRVPSAERTLTRTGSLTSRTLRRSTALTSSDTRSTCFE